MNISDISLNISDYRNIGKNHIGATLDTTSYYLFYRLFLCSYYSRAVFICWEPTGMNNGWIRYIWVIQWRLFDTVSGTHSLSFLFSTVEMSCTTQTSIYLAQLPSSENIHTRVRVPCILAAATIWGWRLFCSKVLIVWLLFKGGNYLRAASIWRETVSCAWVFIRIHV